LFEGGALSAQGFQAGLGPWGLEGLWGIVELERVFWWVGCGAGGGGMGAEVGLGEGYGER
jgi:hypothetical protein